jgi:Ca2+-binding EF-hand superfamily protein
VKVKLFYLSVLLCGVLAPANPSHSRANMDYDADGFISEEEFRNYAAREAAQADTSGNGILDRDEYELSNAEAAAMDTNKDGAIQLSEFQASLMQAFKRLDANRDGRLDEAERRGK